MKDDGSVRSAQAVKQVKLDEMTVDELLELFAEIGVAQDKAELLGEINEYNMLYRQMERC